MLLASSKYSLLFIVGIVCFIIIKLFLYYCRHPSSSGRILKCVHGGDIILYNNNNLQVVVVCLML